MRKTLKTSGKPGRQCQCLFQWPATSYCHQRTGPSRLAGTDPSNGDTATAVCVCVWGMCVHAFARVRACVYSCVRACVCDVFAIYDDNIWPRLVMIIILHFRASSKALVLKRFLSLQWYNWQAAWLSRHWLKNSTKNGKAQSRSVFHWRYQMPKLCRVDS